MRCVVSLNEIYRAQFSCEFVWFRGSGLDLQKAIHEITIRITKLKRVATDERHDYSIFPKTRNRLTPPSGKILNRTCETAPGSRTSSNKCLVWACNFVRASTGFQTNSGS